MELMQRTDDVVNFIRYSDHGALEQGISSFVGFS